QFCNIQEWYFRVPYVEPGCRIREVEDGAGRRLFRSRTDGFRLAWLECQTPPLSHWTEMEIAIAAREVDQPGIRYARGFLLVPCDTSPPDSLRGWEKHPISGYDVYVDPRVNVEKVAVGG